MQTAIHIPVTGAFIHRDGPYLLGMMRGSEPRVSLTVPRSVTRPRLRSRALLLRQGA